MSIKDTEGDWNMILAQAIMLGEIEYFEGQRLDSREKRAKALKKLWSESILNADKRHR